MKSFTLKTDASVHKISIKVQNFPDLGVYSVSGFHVGPSLMAMTVFDVKYVYLIHIYPRICTWAHLY